MKRPALILFLFSIIFSQDELILEKGARYQGVIILVNEHKVHFKANNVAYLDPFRVDKIKKLTTEKQLLIQDGKWKIDVQQYINLSENTNPKLEVKVTNLMIEIETYDGNIFLGNIISENEYDLLLKTKDNVEIKLPTSSIKNRDIVNTKTIDNEVLRADPNKSLYLFAPSAFPIGNKEKYCRDFCVIFPSYNIGLGNYSMQFGAFWSPTNIGNVPLVISGKYSFLQKNSPHFALGLMYVNIPNFIDEFGFGIAFGTMTLGNEFSHFSGSMGWGYSMLGGEWEISDRPIFNLAGNYRISNSIAMVSESWILPNVDVDDNPIMISSRFIGRKFSVDIGGMFSISWLRTFIPFPIINFTFHPG